LITGKYLLMEDSHYDILYETEAVHWWYRVRRKIAIDLIKEYTGADKDKKIADIGCGTGALLHELSVLGKVYGIDSSAKAISYCRQRGLQNLTTGNIDNLPFADDEFDVALCLDVLEHLPDDRRAISEIRRVVRPGGLVIIFVPAFSFLFGVSDIVSKHFRRYGSRELVKKIKEENLEILRCSYFNFFLFLPILAVRKLVNRFKLPMKSENKFNNRFVNKILYVFFYLDSIILKYIDYPFGVSLLVVAKK